MPKTIVTRVLFILTLAYGLGLSAAIIAQLTVLARNPWIELLANMMPLPLAPLVLLAVPAFVVNRRLTAASLCVPLVFATVTYGPLIAPRAAAAATAKTALKATSTPRAKAGPAQITLLSYNLYARDREFEPVIALIRAADADVVAFQELGDAAARAFDDAFAEAYPYRAFHPEPGSNIRGQGLMSRLPLLADDYWRIGLGQQRVVLRAGGRQVAVYNMHLNMPFEFNRLPPFDARKRDAVVDDLLMRLRDERLPVAVTGDFNMNDRSYQYPRITAVLKDSWRSAGAGLGNTWPAVFDGNFNRGELPQRLFPGPFMRIDYVFHNAGLLPLDAKVWPTSAGSDHRPLRVTLAFVDTKRKK